jgi:hypothetical protein
MAVSATTAVQIAIGSFDATGNANQLDYGVSVAPFEITTFKNVPYQAFAPGLKTVNVTWSGFQDYAALAWDEYIRSALSSQQVLTLAYNGATVGTGAVITQGILTDAQNFKAQVGQAPAVDMKVSGVGIALADGQVTQASSGNITATGNTTAVQVGALASTQTVVAAVHVLGYSGTGTVTFQLQSSATSGGAYTARGTAGAALSAVGGQWISATGLTVTDTWWRLAVTASASPVATVLASIAIITP